MNSHVSFRQHFFICRNFSQHFGLDNWGSYYLWNKFEISKFWTVCQKQNHTERRDLPCFLWTALPASCTTLLAPPLETPNRSVGRSNLAHMTHECRKDKHAMIQNMTIQGEIGWGWVIVPQIHQVHHWGTSQRCLRSQGCKHLFNMIHTQRQNQRPKRYKNLRDKSQER